MKQDLESAIDKAYQKMNSENPVTIISQMITDGVYHICHYLLSNYSLENGYFYYHSKLYLYNKNLLHPRVLQKSYDHSMAKYSGVAKIYKIL